MTTSINIKLVVNGDPKLAEEKARQVEHYAATLEGVTVKKAS